jgi:hypothetical protein
MGRIAAIALLCAFIGNAVYGMTDQDQIDPIGINLESIGMDDAAFRLYVVSIQNDELAVPSIVRLENAFDSTADTGRASALINDLLKKGSVNNVRGRVPSGQSHLVAKLWGAKDNPTQAQVWLLNKFSFTDAQTFLRRLARNNTTAEAADSEELKGFYLRARWRKIMIRNEQQADAAKEIFERVRTPISSEEQSYLLNLVQTGLSQKNQDLRNVIFDNYEFAEKETSIAGRTAWLKLFAALTSAPGNLDIDKLQPAFLKYAEWWDGDVMSLATIEQRAQFCYWAHRLWEGATMNLNLIKQRQEEVRKQK